MNLVRVHPHLTYTTTIKPLFRSITFRFTLRPMGSCLSSSDSSSSVRGGGLPAANVITADGRLRQCVLPATANQILLLLSVEEEEQQQKEPSIFLCDSDNLCYDDYIPELAAHHQLLPDHIYFVLPTSKLHYRLSASDMAALAVKASAALPPRSQHRKKARVSPSLHRVAVSNQEERAEKDSALHPHHQRSKVGHRILGKRPGGGMSRSSSIRKLHKYSSRKARMAVRSFRLGLSTIYEGSVLEIGSSFRNRSGSINSTTIFN